MDLFDPLVDLFDPLVGNFIDFPALFCTLFLNKKDMYTMEQKLDRVLEYSLLSAKNVLTLDDTALLTGLSKSYLYRLTCTHQIPYYKPTGKQIYFDRKEVEAWMKQNRYQSAVEAESVAVAHVVASDRQGGVL